MKLAILLVSVVITGAITLFGADDKNISGTWIMQSKDNSCSPAVIRIKMDEGIWRGKLDMPEQELYDKDIYSIKVSGDSVFISVAKDSPVIKAVFVNDSTIAGELLSGGSRDAVQFEKF